METNGSSHYIRYAIVSDVPKLTDLLSQLTGPKWDEVADKSAAYLSFAALKENPNFSCWVALDGDDIIGTISLYLLTKMVHGGSRVGLIEDLVVDSKYRYYGIGKWLTILAINKSRNSGCYKTILNSPKNNIEFYKKCGFEEKEVQMRINHE